MKDLRSITDHLFQESKTPPGDSKERKTFYNYEELPMEKRQGRDVRLVIKGSARVPHYGKTRTRAPVYVPDKVKENMREVLGVDSDDEFRVSVALIALADYALKVLQENEQTLVVSGAKSGVQKTR